MMAYYRSESRWRGGVVSECNKSKILLLIVSKVISADIKNYVIPTCLSPDRPPL